MTELAAPRLLMASKSVATNTNIEAPKLLVATTKLAEKKMAETVPMFCRSKAATRGEEPRSLKLAAMTLPGKSKNLVASNQLAGFTNLAAPKGKMAPKPPRVPKEGIHASRASTKAATPHQKTNPLSPQQRMEIPLRDKKITYPPWAKNLFSVLTRYAPRSPVIFIQ